MSLGFARSGEGAHPARRAFLEQGDVPVGAGEDGRELGKEVAVHLEVRRVSLGDAKETGAPGEERGVRWTVATMEEIPREDPDHAA